MNKNRINNKQYIYTNDPKLEISEFKIMHFAGCFLHYDQNLNIQTEITNSFGEVLIIGNIHRYTVDESIISSSKERHLFRDFYLSTGRWITITEELCFTDPCALLNLYYLFKDKYFYISSSLNLISKLLKEFDERINSYKIKWGETLGPEWYPPPATMIKAVDKLLPSQILNYRLKNLVYIDRYLYKDYEKVNYNDKLKILYATYRAIADKVAVKYKKLFLPLTAGNDSRLSLAAFLSIGKEPELFTFNYPRICKGDKLIPERIAKELNLNFNYIIESEQSDILQAEYDEHCYRVTNDGDRYFYSHNQFRKLKGDINACIIRSSISDLSRLLYREKFKLINNWTILTSENIVSSYGGELSNDFLINALERWINWHKTYDTTRIDWRDIFYIEQRMAGWLADIEQSIDLLPIDSLQISNSQFIIDLFLSFSPIERSSSNYKHGRIEPDLINLLYPRLNRYPYNPLYKSEVAKKMIKFIFKKLKNIFSVINL